MPKCNFDDRRFWKNCLNFWTATEKNTLNKLKCNWPGHPRLYQEFTVNNSVTTVRWGWWLGQRKGEYCLYVGRLWFWQLCCTLHSTGIKEAAGWDFWLKRWQALADDAKNAGDATCFIQNTERCCERQLTWSLSFTDIKYIFHGAYKWCCTKGTIFWPWPQLGELNGAKMG